MVFPAEKSWGSWSSLNKARIERLIGEGLMSAAGQKVIDEAIADGSWSQTDEVDALVIPPDLDTVLDVVPGTRGAFDALPDSTRRQHLWWIHSAKRAVTRSNRIEELMRHLSEDD